MKFWPHILRKKIRGFPLRAQAGFTLIEILVVITIFTIVGAGIAETFSSGMKIWARAQKAGESSIDVFVAIETIGRDLRQSVNIRSVGFEGREDEISFLTFRDDSAVKVIYKFNPAQKELVRRQIDLKDAFSDDLQGKYKYAEKKVATLDDFSFSYFNFDKEKEEYVWSDEWAKEQGIFEAVKLKARFGDEKDVKTVFIPIW